MQGVATWLVARPLNSVLALAVTVSLAYLSFLSGVVLILLILQKGTQRALLDVGLACGLMLVVGMITRAPLEMVLFGALAIWLPALLLGSLLTLTRSLTLTVQLSVIIVLVATGGMYLVVGDAAEFWRPVITSIITMWREMGLTEQANLAEAQIDSIVKQMTILAAVTIWSVHTVSCVLGYLLYRQLPEKSACYGRFRDLNLGRVIAITMALASVAALISGAVWLQDLAFVMFAMFWLQGMAVVHWMHGQGYLPVFGVVAVYVLLPILNVIMLMGLAVFGYIDSWFRLRRGQAA